MKEICDKYNIIYTLGDYLFLMNKNVSLVNVGDINTPFDSSSTLNLYRSNSALKEGLFLRYSMEPENIGREKDAIMLNFLLKYNIRQMIVSRSADIPKGIMRLVNNIILDSISKERFLTFNLTANKTATVFVH